MFPMRSWCFVGFGACFFNDLADKHQAPKAEVTGSNPVGCAISKFPCYFAIVFLWLCPKWGPKLDSFVPFLTASNWQVPTWNCALGRGFGVASDFAQCLVTCSGFDLLWPHPGSARRAQALRKPWAELGQARLIAAIPEPIAKASSGEGCAKFGQEERHVVGRPVADCGCEFGVEWDCFGSTPCRWRVAATPVELSTIYWQLRACLPCR